LSRNNSSFYCCSLLMKDYLFNSRLSVLLPALTNWTAGLPRGNTCRKVTQSGICVMRTANSGKGGWIWK